MKNLRYIYSRALIVLFIVSIASCDIDEYNPSGATAEQIWSTPEGFVTAVNGAYFELRYWYGKEDGSILSEAGTDIWFNKGYASQLTQYAGLSATVGANTNAWRSLFSAINVCNAGISRIGSAGFTDDTERKKREGELRFLRAFYYWHVVETWGGVMLKTKETTTSELTAQRSPVEDFYDVIISDLELAAEYLPNDWGTEYSRATKKAALGFLARAYLSRAYYGDATNYFTKARDVAKRVIDEKTTLGTALKASYADLWNSATANKNAVKPGGEALFVISNSLNYLYDYDGNANRLHAFFQTPYTNVAGLAMTLDYGYDRYGLRLSPTRALLDFFDETRDSRYDATFQELWKENTVFTFTANDVSKYPADVKDPSVVGKTIAIGDTALFITKREVKNKSLKPYVVYDRTTAYNSDGTFNPNVNSFVNLKKFKDYTRTVATTAVGYSDVIVMRLAEMYMIAAEAELQLGNKSAAADYINVLRTRAAIKTPVNQTAAMQITADDVTLDFILDENAREFAGEYRRWFDLKRTGKLLERVQKYNPNITQIQPYHTLRPIPTTELQALTNGVEFGQNEGYQ